MPRVGFEPAFPLFQMAKTVYAVVRAATVIGGGSFTKEKIKQMSLKIKNVTKMQVLASDIRIYYTYKIMRKQPGSHSKLTLLS
jgi:hypothetical protein